MNFGDFILLLLCHGDYSHGQTLDYDRSPGE